MNVWKLTAAGKLELAEEPVPATVDGKMKVRITKVLLGDTDAEICRGETQVKYPLIPGRFAVGIIAEDYGESFPKGTRVLLHTFLPARDSGTEKIDFSDDDYEVCGLTQDGFLRDIISVSPDEITPIPDIVNDENALLLHYISMAKAVVDCLNAGKGKHIAVVGADFVGIIVCQLLIYQQSAPMLIDTDRNKLDFARACGIYYTYHADEELIENIGTVTGGRLADGAVFLTDSHGNNPALPFLVSAKNTHVVIGGFAPFTEKLGLELAVRKQITIHCLSSCTDNPEQAINLVANHAANLDAFHAHAVNADSVTETLTTYNGEEEMGNYTYFKLL